MKLVFQIAAGVFIASMATFFVASLAVGDARHDAAIAYANASYDLTLRHSD